MSDYRALYRKWRPRDFDDVQGQAGITDILKYEVANSKLSHAYLFCGSRGTGKTSCAKILSKAVNCLNPKDGNPCNECRACKSIDIGIATDVIEMDAASNNGINDVRDMQDEIAFTPADLKYRVYIIDEVHMMSTQAFNALLKTLEEPPEYVIFILATTEYNKLPTTIVSRCQRFDFKRIAGDCITARLLHIAKEEGVEITEDAARVIARISRGGLRDAISLFELCMTGGYSVHDGKQLKYFSCKPLTEFDNFDDFYASFIAETKRVLWANLQYQDTLSEYVEQHRPSFLISAMVDDCLNVGRNMHGGGARYHDYGSSFIGIPNVADSMFALKKAVFDLKLCSAEELLAALKANFEGYEALRGQLLKLPKFGQDNAEADELAAKLTSDICNIYTSYVNRFGGNGKPVILTFRWAASSGAIVGATPDGRKAGTALAHAVTPQGMSMTKGITAAINSCTNLPFECFTGGASTMWDLDHSWASEPVAEALFMAFFKQGGHIFQGNVTDVETLVEAQKNPEQFNHVIVRVGGYSARFISLPKDIQDDIINRVRHCR